MSQEENRIRRHCKEWFGRVETLKEGFSEKMPFDFDWRPGVGRR